MGNVKGVESRSTSKAGEISVSPVLDAKRIRQSGAGLLLRNGKLRFKLQVGAEERDMETLLSSQQLSAQQRRWRGRPDSVVAIGEPGWNLGKIRSWAKRVDGGDAEPEVNPVYGLDVEEGGSDTLKRCLNDDPEEGCETHLVCALIFDGEPEKKQPVGIATLLVSLVARPRQELAPEFEFNVSLLTVYVAKSARKLGYGFDLAVGVGMFIRSTFRAFGMRLPAGAKLSTILSADYYSKGGEAFARHLHVCLCIAAEDVSTERMDVTVETPSLEAGY
jgi:hypothetical protein